MLKPRDNWRDDTRYCGNFCRSVNTKLFYFEFHSRRNGTIDSWTAYFKYVDNGRGNIDSLFSPTAILLCDQWIDSAGSISRRDKLDVEFQDRKNYSLHIDQTYSRFQHISTETLLMLKRIVLSKIQYNVRIFVQVRSIFIEVQNRQPLSHVRFSRTCYFNIRPKNFFTLIRWYSVRSISI